MATLKIGLILLLIWECSGGAQQSYYKRFVPEFAEPPDSEAHLLNPKSSLPPRGRGDNSPKPLLGGKVPKTLTEKPVRGGYTGRPQKVEIAHSIYESNKGNGAKKHLEILHRKKQDDNQAKVNFKVDIKDDNSIIIDPRNASVVPKMNTIHSNDRNATTTDPKMENIQVGPRNTRQLRMFREMDKKKTIAEKDEKQDPAEEYERKKNEHPMKTNEYETETKEYETKTNENETKASEYEAKTNEHEIQTNEYETKTNEYDYDVTANNQSESDIVWRTAMAGGKSKGGKKEPLVILHGHKTAEHKLMEYLFDGYNRNIRPTIFGGEVTTIFFELSLFDILVLDTRKRQIIINTEMIMKWKDFHLVWNPKDFEGVDIIRVPYYDIWTPDVMLHNTADTDYESAIINTFAIINSYGDVELLSHALFKSVCELDVTWYPFDQQVCSLHFSSWTYDVTGIKLTKGPALLSDYNENPAFAMENFWSEAKDQFNPCCPNPFSAITYNIQVQRRIRFPMFFFIMPGILINICAILVFSLPAETGEKVGLGINSMLAMIVFLMAMTENLPPTEKIPLAGMFYGVALALITTNICCSIYVLNLNFSGFRGTPIPDWVKTFSLVFAKIQGIRIPIIVRKNWDYDTEEDKKKRFPLNLITIEKRVPDENSCPYHDHSKDDAPEEITFIEPPITDDFQRRCVEALEKITKVTEKREVRRVKNEKENGLVEEWKFISRVLDRFLFIIFILAVSGFNINILTSSPFGVQDEYCPLGNGNCGNLTREEIEKIDPHDYIVPVDLDSVLIENIDKIRAELGDEAIISEGNIKLGKGSGHGKGDSSKGTDKGASKGGSKGH